MENTDVNRSLKTRHLSMIALGGSIGTGLFVASGSSISTAGPGGALIAYVAIGIMVYFLMTSLGEMATYMPVTGSFATYATKFIDPALGFALGWNYWFNWAITLAVDLSTISIVIKYWFPSWDSWKISLTFLVVLFVINIVSVGSFGETEYWLASIKVTAVIVFLIVGILSILGILGNQHFVGLTNFTYKKAPFVGGVPAILSVFVVAGFSFQGTELIGITAGESATPEKSIPKAIKQVFWRILLFYILSIAVIGALIPYTSPNLLGSGATDIAISPFTIVFNKVGIPLAAGVMNAVILTSVISAANSGLYAASRMLWSMSKQEMAPKAFQRTNNRGVPLFSLILTAVVGGIALFTSLYGNQFYQLLVAASGLTGFIAWLGIAFSHYRFRKAYLFHGYSLDDLKYKAKWFPFGPILAIVLGIIIIIGQDVRSLVDFNVIKLLVSYSGLILLFLCWIYYKVRYKTKFLDLKDIDIEAAKKHKY
ncbi:amino acid permease [Companilactobacillus ginsenosidimutans]|uniref:Gamma-aminobutyrate permease n=1 Tax=Companilactobacillus ginsenosidimutans TaxID=1007676 RepID=A0A0H4QMW4_9LACO|nr:amino acid permease [Companilactobacillus ginsenosidimutans]AKP68058.1 gamma-aminobutyrate permease [Companilactobacillus ginsenosidimutans]